MIDNTINDDKTIAGGGEGAILAGRYHILRRLGQGGMGAVWLAEDRQLDNRKVAIKMLPSIVVTDKRAYNQLKGEALVALKLIHPNIVTLRAFEENNGAPFLVMDYIEGRTLSDYLAEKGKLSEAETIKLLKPIAAALDYAHSEKVIHRDVKPSNIIIRNDGHPFILDFGIAREIQESMTRMTGGTISGTLLYMSPEQLRGAPPAPAQDVYSFAAMCYECLSGNPPFTKGEIAYQIVNVKPMTLIAGVKLVASVMAGLSKEPENRPMNCAAVLIDGHGYRSEEIVVDESNAHDKSRYLMWMIIVSVATVIGCVFVAGHYFLIKKTVVKNGEGIECASADVKVFVQRRKTLSNLHWSYYTDDYYLHSTGEQEKAKQILNKSKTGNADELLWALPTFAGISDMFEDSFEKDHANLVIAKKFDMLFKSGKWDEGWLVLNGNDIPDNPVWQFYRGVCAENGYGGEEKNLARAIRFYRKAAEAWCLEALFNLGLSYELGYGVVKDEYRAACFYYRAYLMGDNEAVKCWLNLKRQNLKIAKEDPVLLILNTHAYIRKWPLDFNNAIKTTALRLYDSSGELWLVPREKVSDFIKENNNEFGCCYLLVRHKKSDKDIFLDELDPNYVDDDKLCEYKLEGRWLCIEDANRQPVLATIKDIEFLAELYVKARYPKATCKPRDVFTNVEYNTWKEIFADAGILAEFNQFMDKDRRD